MAYAPKIMSAWVTDVPNMNGRSAPLMFRFLTAMQGALGIGANLNKWTVQDEKTATQMVALYKRVRPTVQTGDLYRLFSPRVGDLTANEYVEADGKQAVLFAFRHSQQYNTAVPAIRLRGLDPKALYRVEATEGKLQERQAQLSGAYLMSVGLNLNLRGDYDAAAVVIERM
jgi:alpha-galactosidase